MGGLAATPALIHHKQRLAHHRVLILAARHAAVAFGRRGRSPWVEGTWAILGSPCTSNLYNNAPETWPLEVRTCCTSGSVAPHGLPGTPSGCVYLDRPRQPHTHWPSAGGTCFPSRPSSQRDNSFLGGHCRWCLRGSKGRSCRTLKAKLRITQHHFWHISLVKATPVLPSSTGGEMDAILMGAGVAGGW